MNELKMGIVNELRPCMVDGRKHLFHRWIESRWLVDASPLQGGHPGGLCARTMALVEDENGQVREVYPSEINFLDTPSHMTELGAAYHREGGGMMNGKVMAALWTIWGAIQQTAKFNTYDETIKWLYEISKKAMIKAGLIQEKGSTL